VTVDRSDLLQGTLDMLILKIVALGPVHGYGISQRIQQVSREVLQVQQGSLYPALHRLEKRGWLAATWGESESGRQAKFYRLSAKGRKQLQLKESQWNRLAEAIALVLFQKYSTHKEKRGGEVRNADFAERAKSAEFVDAE